MEEEKITDFSTKELFGNRKMRNKRLDKKRKDVINSKMY